MTGRSRRAPQAQRPASWERAVPVSGDEPKLCAGCGIVATFKLVGKHNSVAVGRSLRAYCTSCAKQLHLELMPEGL